MNEIEWLDEIERIKLKKKSQEIKYVRQRMFTEIY